MSSKTRNSVTHTRAVVAESLTLLEDEPLIAMRNHVTTVSDATAPTAPTGGAGLVSIVSMIVTAKSSGRFMVGFNLNFTGATAADTVQFQVRSQWTSSLFIIGGGTTVADSRSVGGVGAIQVANTNAGLSITGGGNGVLWFDTGSQVQGTGETTGNFPYTAMLDMNESPGGFALGDKCCFFLQEAIGAHTTTFVCTNAWAYEMP